MCSASSSCTLPAHDRQVARLEAGLLGRRLDLREGRLVGAFAVGPVADDRAKALLARSAATSAAVICGLTDSPSLICLDVHCVCPFRCRRCSRPAAVPVQRALTGTFSIGLPSLSFGTVAGPHVHLQRRNDQPRHVERGVALGAELDELLLRLAAADMDVVRLFLADRGFPLDVAAIRAVVVAHEQAHLVRQRQHLLDRVVKRAGIAAGEIGAGRAAIRHEQRVADKGRIADHMDHAGGRVARRVHGEGLHVADLVGVAILEQRVELRAVALELGAFVEDLAEGVLHDDDLARRCRSCRPASPGCRARPTGDRHGHGSR